MRYPDPFKQQMVRRLTAPGAPSATALAKEVGVSQTTLSRWVHQAGTVSTMTKRKKKRLQDWTAEEKLAVLTEAAGLSEKELGGFLRGKGLHRSHLDQWRRQSLEALGLAQKKRSKRSGEATRIRELERELRRKDKALAEASALLILKKNHPGLRAPCLWA